MTKTTINKVKKTSHEGEDIYDPQIISRIYVRTLINHKEKHKLPDRNMGKEYEPTIHIRRYPNGQ